jgi:hypothetical protein
MHLSERSAPLLSLFEIGNMYFRKLTSWQVEYFTDKLCSTVFIQNIYHPLTHSKKSSRHSIFRGLLSYSSVNAHIHSVVAKSCTRWYFCWWFLTLLTLLQYCSWRDYHEILLIYWCRISQPQLH